MSSTNSFRLPRNPLALHLHRPLQNLPRANTVSGNVPLEEPQSLGQFIKERLLPTSPIQHCHPQDCSCTTSQVGPTDSVLMESLDSDKVQTLLCPEHPMES